MIFFVMVHTFFSIDSLYYFPIFLINVTLPAADVCDSKNLRFNGGYYCTSTDKFICTLNCPTESEFEFPPAAIYTCTYDTGIFKPQPIPQCKIKNDMKIVERKTSYDTYIRESNYSWSTQDFFNGSTKSSPGFYNIHHNSTNTVINTSHTNLISIQRLFYSELDLFRIKLICNIISIRQSDSHSKH